MLNFPSAPAVNQVFSSGPTWMWDGVKWKAALAAPAVTVLAPTTGLTVVLTDYLPVFINNALVLAALTIWLPPAMVNGFVDISFRRSVTVLSVRDAAGVVVSTAPTSAYGPGAALFFRYVDATVKWEYWK